MFLNLNLSSPRLIYSIFEHTICQFLSDQVFTQAVEVDSKDAMLRFSLANALVQVNDMQGALKHFKRSTELDKKEAKYNIEYGRYLKLAGGDLVAGEEQIQIGLKKGTDQQLFQVTSGMRVVINGWALRCSTVYVSTEQ